jgi:hypothetical protein
LVEESMVPAPVQPYLGDGPEAAVLVYGSLACVGLTLLLLLIGLWQLFGRGPRRRRAFARARHQLQQGDWKQAFETVRMLQSQGRLSRSWEGRLRNLEGECRHKAGDEAVREKRWEDAVEYYGQAAVCLNLDVGVLRERVDAMLAESRRLFAQERRRSPRQHRLVGQGRPFPCADPAIALPRRRRSAAPSASSATARLTRASVADYGHSRHRPAVHRPAAVPRMPSSCPRRAQEGAPLPVRGQPRRRQLPSSTLQLGMAMVAAGGDQKIAAGALDRAVGTRGWACGRAARRRRRRR